MNAAANHVLQSTLFALLACLINLTLLRKNSPQSRYAVWLAASVKFLIPFAALSALGCGVGCMHYEPQASFYYAVDDVSRRVVPDFVALSRQRVANPFPDLLPIVWIC